MKRVLIILAACILCLSCTKQQRDLVYANQEDAIEKFVTSQTESNPDARVVYNEGAVRIVIGEGRDVEASARATVGFNFAGYDFTGGSLTKDHLFSTNDRDVASSNGWKVSDDTIFQTKTVNLAETDILEGLKRGLVGVRADEECYILFSGKYAFGKSGIGTIPANAPLAFHIWIKTVQN